MSASAVSAPQVQAFEASPVARCQSVSSQVRLLGPVTGSQPGILQDASQGGHRDHRSRIGWIDWASRWSFQPFKLVPVQSP